MDTDIHTRRTSCDDEDRDWGGAHTNQEHKILLENHQKLESYGTDVSSWSLERTSSADTLILDF